MSRFLIERDIRQIIAEANKEGWTQSEITTMDNCPKMWFWRYGSMLRRIGSMSWATAYGSAFHGTMEDVYATKGKRWSPRKIELPPDIVMTADKMKEMDYWKGVLDVQTDCYVSNYKDDFELFEVKSLERKIDIEFEGIRFRGMVDLTFSTPDGRVWILDHKTTSRMDLKTVQGWDFRFQFMFYLWLASRDPELQQYKFAGYYINAIKKPTIRVKNGETLPQFFERLRMEMMMEPEKYYYRDRLLMDKRSLEHFENEVLRPKINRIKLLTDPETSDSIINSIVKNMNTDQCQRYGACSFLPLCSHGIDIEGFQYTQRSTKHEELEGESEE